MVWWKNYGEKMKKRRKNYEKMMKKSWNKNGKIKNLETKPKTTKKKIMNKNFIDMKYSANSVC